MAKVLIADSFTLPGKYSNPNLAYPDVTFKYRPALPETSWDFWLKPKDNGKDYRNAAVELLVAHVKEWDVEELETDAVAKIDEANLRRVPRPILDFMINCVTGYIPAKAKDDAKN